MRKILILILLVSVLIGAAMPATALFDTNIAFNNAIVTQTQVTVPINIAVLGSATQLTIQQTTAVVDQNIFDKLGNDW